MASVVARLRPCALPTLVAVLAVGCGKKGAPLAPLRLVPAAAGEVGARRVDDEVRLRFVVPSTNANGPGPVNLAKIEIFAISVAPGGVTPPNRELTTSAYRIGEVPVRPAPVEGQPAEPGDKRPGPGEQAVFVEHLPPGSPALTPPPPASPAPPLPAAPAAAAGPSYPVRIYVLRGVTHGGRPGPPSARVQIPLVDPPPAPSSLSEKVAESGVTIDWVPPLAAVEGPAFAYNVYAGEGTGALNPAPIAGTTFEHGGVEFGVERCYRVRTVVTVVGVSIEGASSAPHCVTPRDTFPPAAPRELRAVAGDGVMNLGWDANTERDLAGYLVLRGEAPGATLQALTPAPIRETTYKDTTVKPGVRYTYAVVAVDTAMPPNTSAQARTDETAR